MCINALPHILDEQINPSGHKHKKFCLKSPIKDEMRTLAASKSLTIIRLEFLFFTPRSFTLSSILTVYLLGLNPGYQLLSSFPKQPVADGSSAGDYPSISISHTLVSRVSVQSFVSAAPLRAQRLLIIVGLGGFRLFNIPQLRLNQSKCILRITKLQLH